MNAFDNDTAWNIFMALCEHGVVIGNGSIPIIAKEIDAAIAAAVAAEREACARVSDDVVNAALTPPKNRNMARIASAIAASIRARNGAGSK